VVLMIETFWLMPVMRVFVGGAVRCVTLHTPGMNMGLRPEAIAALIAFVSLVLPSHYAPQKRTS
jgi:hypothetical protein